MIPGSDGLDYSFRQKVAAHYQIRLAIFTFLYVEKNLEFLPNFTMFICHIKIINWGKIMQKANHNLKLF